MDDIYGREKRVKYFSMLSNIRHAARSSRGSRPGTMTPRSYYMSQRSIASQVSGVIFTGQMCHAIVFHSNTVRARLHQAAASTLWQLCDNTSDPVLIENNVVTSEWGLQAILVLVPFQ